MLATVDPSKGAVRVFNNVIVNGGRGPTTPEGGGNYSCIYVAGYTNNGSPGSGTVEIFNNSMYNCGANHDLGPNGISFARRNTNINVKLDNNIIVQSANQPYLVNFDGPVSSLTGSNNIFYGNGPAPTGTGLGGSLNVDPLYINGASGDLHLRSGSPPLATAWSMAWPPISTAFSAPRRPTSGPISSPRAPHRHRPLRPPPPRPPRNRPCLPSPPPAWRFPVHRRHQPWRAQRVALQCRWRHHSHL